MNGNIFFRNAASNARYNLKLNPADHSVDGLHVTSICVLATIRKMNLEPLIFSHTTIFPTLTLDKLYANE